MFKVLTSIAVVTLMHMALTLNRHVQHQVSVHNFEVEQAQKTRQAVINELSRRDKEDSATTEKLREGLRDLNKQTTENYNRYVVPTAPLPSPESNCNVAGDCHARD